MANKNLLTPEEKQNVFNDYPCLDHSILEENLETEVDMLLEAQHAKDMARLDSPELNDDIEDILIKVATEPLATKPNGIQDELAQIIALLKGDSEVGGV